MIQTSLTDAEVVQRIVAGETALFEIIVRRYNPYLYKVGRGYNFSHEDTQDLMQDSFVDAYRSLSQFEGRSNMKTWLVRIMLNYCYHRKNKSSYMNELHHEIHDDAVPMFADSKKDTANVIHNIELGKIVEQALSQLPEEYRLVFSLREINGHSVQETASLLAITETNVKVRLNRAKAMLRQNIERTYSSEELFEFNAVYCDAMVQRVMNIILH